LALQHPDLVAEDDQLDILVGLAASGRHDERQNPAQPEVRERECHRFMMTGICANCQLKALIEIVASFSLLFGAIPAIPATRDVEAVPDAFPSGSLKTLACLLPGIQCLSARSWCCVASES